MNDKNGKSIECGNNVKYSFNSFGVPVFTGRVICKDGDLYIKHSNKVTVRLDDSIKYIEIVF